MGCACAVWVPSTVPQAPKEMGVVLASLRGLSLAPPPLLGFPVHCVWTHSALSWASVVTSAKTVFPNKNVLTETGG